MNMYISKKITKAFEATNDYIEAISDVCKKYSAEVGRAKQESLKFVAAEQVFHEDRAKLSKTAKASLDAAHKKLCDSVFQLIPEMNSALLEHLTELPSDRFTKIFDAYSKYGISPSKNELKVLLAESNGSHIALRALNEHLKRSDSDFEISFINESQLEDDIKTVTKIADMRGSLAELRGCMVDIELYSDKRFQTLPDKKAESENRFFFKRQLENEKSRIHREYMTDDIGFRIAVESLPEIAQRWAGNTLPTIEEIRRDNPVLSTQEAKEARKQAQEQNVSAAGVQVTEKPGQFGKQAGERISRQTADAKRGLLN